MNIYGITWAPRAAGSYADIIAYLEEHWTEKEVIVLSKG